jgi:hypothetical protein
LDNAPIFLDAWRSGLRERGWIERKNLLVEYRYTQPIDRYPALAAELTALSPDLVVAAGAQPAVALKSATTTIPIVFVTVRTISSSRRPPSAASKICARLSLRAACLPPPSIAVSSSRSAWLNSTR